MTQRYGIAHLAEASAYLADPLLRQRLEAVIAVIDAQLRQPGQSLEHLMGSGTDAAKTASSLTLFEAAGLESAGALLDRIEWRCTPTLEPLSLAPGRFSCHARGSQESQQKGMEQAPGRSPSARALHGKPSLVH